MINGFMNIQIGNVINLIIDFKNEENTRKTLTFKRIIYI